MTNDVLIGWVKEGDFLGTVISHLGQWEGELIHGRHDPRPNQFGTSFDQEPPDFVGVQIQGDVKGRGGRCDFAESVP